MSQISRRRLIRTGALGAAASTIGLRPSVGVAAPVQPATSEPFRYCLNTSTIRGQELTITEEVSVTAKAGYTGIEPWMRKIAAFTDGGGKLSDLRKQLDDSGLTIESAIGFAKWIVDDEATRKSGFEEAKRDMAVLAELGGKRIAAPPAGAQKQGTNLDLDAAGERYHQLLDLGQEMGVTPQIEVWGFSANLTTLQESMYVAFASGHPDACLLGDVYHFYKGGSSHQGLRMLGPNALQSFHMNDYPDIPREKISDADRVYPGDGVGPVTEILQIFDNVGARPVLSLELFNREFWKQDPLEVATTGLAKMKAAVAAAGLA